ncbi:hypothetical protein [Xanthobacter sp. KR7-225]|uniref:hypothetical protein n=1 Tax=Xanthobacter sp. KR7-225 TaxID=3156613 RepID=UPI0032B5D98D
MPQFRAIVFTLAALSVIPLIALYPSYAFQVVAGIVIILSTASTLVFFGFALRAAFLGVNERRRAQRMQVNQMTHGTLREEAPPAVPAPPR